MKRTSLSLDADVDREIRQIMHQDGRSLRQTVNELLRLAIKQSKQDVAKIKPFQVKPFELAFRPGIDSEKLNQLSDQLETDAFKDNL